MDSITLGRIFIVGGAIISLIGVALILGLHKSNLFSWFGKLPGDFSYSSETTQVYAPIASMILISIVISIVFNLVSRLMR